MKGKIKTKLYKHLHSRTVRVENPIIDEMIDNGWNQNDLLREAIAARKAKEPEPVPEKTEPEPEW